jgi:hypothetical protein
MSSGAKPTPSPAAAELMAQGLPAPGAVQGDVAYFMKAKTAVKRKCQFLQTSACQAFKSNVNILRTSPNFLGAIQEVAVGGPDLSETGLLIFKIRFESFQEMQSCPEKSHRKLNGRPKSNGQETISYLQ